MVWNEKIERMKFTRRNKEIDSKERQSISIRKKEGKKERKKDTKGV